MTGLPEAPALTFLATLNVKVGPALDVGMTPEGQRRVIPIVGGTVSGPRLQGKVLPAGADYQVQRDAGLTELDARYVVELEDGAMVYVHNQALRSGAAEDLNRLNSGEDVDPALIYFRCTPRFSTAAPELAWLNRVVTLGTGRRRPGSVEIDVFTVG